MKLQIKFIDKDLKFEKTLEIAEPIRSNLLKRRNEGIDAVYSAFLSVLYEFVANHGTGGDPRFWNKVKGLAGLRRSK